MRITVPGRDNIVLDLDSTLETVGDTVYVVRTVGVTTDGVPDVETFRRVHHRKTRQLRQRLADEERRRQAELRQLTEDERARDDSEIKARVTRLKALKLGGIVLTIAKDYPSYTSEWEYYCCLDGTLVRRRGQDEATVTFANFEELMEDLSRYRWAGFDLV